jgi:hypothetical protein
MCETYGLNIVRLQIGPETGNRLGLCRFCTLSQEFMSYPKGKNNPVMSD